MIKKILVVGGFSLDPNVYTYATSFYNNLIKLGYQVDLFNTRKNWGLFKELNNHFCNVFLLKKVAEFKPDLVFFIKSQNITSKTIKKIKNKFGCLLVNFYPDNPFVFWNGNSNSNVLNSLPFYDCFLIWSKKLVSALESAGCKKVYYFPFAYDQDLFETPASSFDGLRMSGAYASDVCFVGSWGQDREKWLSEICKRLPNLNLAIWGNMWEENLAQNSILKNKLRGKAIYGAEMIKVFKGSKIVLNFIRKQNMTSHNMRTIEVPASGAFLLTERTYEQARFLFTENESIACFSSIAELIKKIKLYIKLDGLRDAISKNGQKRAKNFTMHHVLNDFMNYIKG